MPGPGASCHDLLLLVTRPRLGECTNPGAPPGLPDTAQEEQINSGYFAGRNATWIMSATPGAGWNE
jgi:hypothetical protein